MKKLLTGALLISLYSFFGHQQEISAQVRFLLNKYNRWAGGAIFLHPQRFLCE